MGEAVNVHDPSSFPHLPGSMFFPSEQQLLCYYLTSKNTGTNYYGTDVIKELDLYNFDPFNLPESACFRFGREGRRRHWYFYVVLRERGWRRAAGGGYWKKKGRSRNVVHWGSGKVVVGRRNCFVFYLGNCWKSAVKTRWVMYEYALIDHHVISFVLCRVFFKCNRPNDLSEHVISSCIGESVATIRHFGVQCDRPDTLSVVSKEHDNDPQDDEIKSSSFSKGLDIALDHQISHKPDLQKFVQEFVAIWEDDYIELDDLLQPLPEID